MPDGCPLYSALVLRQVVPRNANENKRFSKKELARIVRGSALLLSLFGARILTDVIGFDFETIVQTNLRRAARYSFIRGRSFRNQRGAR